MEGGAGTVGTVPFRRPPLSPGRGGQVRAAGRAERDRRNGRGAREAMLGPLLRCGRLYRAQFDVIGVLRVDFD